MEWSVRSFPSLNSLLFVPASSPAKTNSTRSISCSQLAKFSETFPKQLHVYTYALATMSSGVAAVFASYAWAPWS